MTSTPVLTFSILTIPEREQYLRRLFASIAALDGGASARVDVIYNRPLEGALSDAIARIRDEAPTLPIDVYFNAGETSISAGRNLQLSVCRTPVIAFVDDDLSLHGSVVPSILDTLDAHPVALVGLPSFDGDTDNRLKPRDSTPSVDWRGLRLSPVQGMLCAGYRALLADVGGFNTRRRFWGEWTELNLRLWRSGFPTAYQLDGRAFLRHWRDAPSSPTRNMEGRERHVVWGLICTALEYDAVDISEATEVFWRLVEDRYLAYSYGDELSPRNVLRTVLELVPQISAEWSSIQEFRARAAAHPFSFAPFHRFTMEEVRAVWAHATPAIRVYRAHVARDRAHANGHARGRRLRSASVGHALQRLMRSLRRLRQQV